jgi:hypothetical protein
MLLSVQVFSRQHINGPMRTHDASAEDWSI